MTVYNTEESCRCLIREKRADKEIVINQNGPSKKIFDRDDTRLRLSDNT